MLFIVLRSFNFCRRYCRAANLFSLWLHTSTSVATIGDRFFTFLFRCVCRRDLQLHAFFDYQFRGLMYIWQYFTGERRHHEDVKEHHKTSVVMAVKRGLNRWSESARVIAVFYAHG